MPHLTRCAMLVLAAVSLSPSLNARLQRAGSSAGDATATATSRIVTAAQAVLKSLDDGGRAKVQFAYDDAAQRLRWSNLPSPMVERRGIRMGDLTDVQRASVMALLKEALSANGYRKVNEIMRGDEVLRTQGGGRGPGGGGGRGPGGGGGRGPGGGGPAFGLDN